MNSAVLRDDGPHDASPDARIRLAGYGSARAELVRASTQVQLPSMVTPRLGAAVEEALAGAELLCVVVGDEPQAAAQAAAQLRAAREADGLSLVFAPRRVHEQLRPYADALGDWPSLSQGGDLVGARRQRLAATDLVHWLRALDQLLNERGLVCVDYADVRCIIHRAGPAVLAVGEAAGPARVEAALAKLRARLAAQGVDRRAYGRAVLAVRSADDFDLREFEQVVDGLEQLLPNLTTTCAGVRLHPRQSIQLNLLIAGEPEAPQQESKGEPVPIDVPAFLRRRRDG